MRGKTTEQKPGVGRREGRGGPQGGGWAEGREDGESLFLGEGGGRESEWLFCASPLKHALRPPPMPSMVEAFASAPLACAPLA